MPVLTLDDGPRHSVGLHQSFESVSAAAGLMNHPCFDDAVAVGAEAVIDGYQGNWTANRIMNDRGRAVAAIMLLALHSSADGPGFTVARLREEALQHGFASPRRITAWVATLRFLGFLEPIASKRPERLLPAEKFLSLHRERLSRTLKAVVLVHPLTIEVEAGLADPAFIGHCAEAFIVLYRAGWRVLNMAPELTPIVERDAGLTVVLSLFLAQTRGEPVSIAELARRFKVSRAHVLAIFRETEAAGLAVRDGPRTDFRLTPAFSASIRRFFAAVFLTNIYMVDSALARSAPPPPP